MGIASYLTEKYRELLEIAFSSYRDYRDLRRDHLVLMVGISLSIALSLIIQRIMGRYGFELGALIAVAGSIASAHRVLTRISASMERIRGASEEMPYAVFMASAAARTGLELVDAIYFIASREASVFRYLRPIARKIVNIASYMDIESSIEAIRGVPKNIKRILISYLASIRLGTGIESLVSLGFELIKEASRQASRSIVLSAQAGLLAVLVLTTTPILMLGLSLIAGGYVALLSSLSIALTLPMILLAIPQPPLPLRPIYIKPPRYVSLSLIAGPVSMAVLVVAVYLPLFITIDLRILREAILILSALMIFSGLAGAQLFTQYIKNIGRARDILFSASQYVKVYRTLGGFNIDLRIHSLGFCAPWVLFYIALSLEFFMERGDIEPLVFNRFSEEMQDLIAKNMGRILTSLIPLAASLLQPFFLSGIMYMGGSRDLYSYILVAVSCIASAAISSKVVFGTARNTLIPGLSLLLLHMLLPQMG